MDQCIKEFEHQNGTIPLVSINNNVSGNQYNTISGA